MKTTRPMRKNGVRETTFKNSICDTQKKIGTQLNQCYNSQMLMVKKHTNTTINMALCLEKDMKLACRNMLWNLVFELW